VTELRLSRSGDIPALRELWERVFHDTADTIDALFDEYADDARIAVAEVDGKLAAAAYLLPVGEFVAEDGTRTPCSMIYAVATLPKYRGMSLGLAVTRELVRSAGESGHVAVLCPAEESLYDYYKKCGFCACFTEREVAFAATGEREASAELVPPEEYAALRERFLTGVPHVAQDARVFRLQSRWNARSPSGLYRIMRAGETVGCAVLAVTDDGARVPELLGDIEFGAAAIMSVLGAETLTARVPDVRGNRAGMAVGLSGVNGAWYGLALD
jgi:predicted N-acetyltransferase YhbS